MEENNTEIICENRINLFLTINQELPMKVETVIKVLKRYAKGLNVMACDCKTEDEKADKQHYQFDKQVFEEAIRLIESRKE